MKELLNIIIIVCISAVTGGIVSLPISIVEGNSLISGFLQGSGAGAVIGFTARFAFSAVYIRFRKHPLPAFAAMAGCVGVGTLIGCIIMGVTMVPTALIVIAGSVIVGLILTGIIFRYSNRLNNRLKLKQNTLAGNDKNS